MSKLASDIAKNMQVNVDSVNSKIVVSFDSLEGIVDLQNNTITLDFEHIPIFSEHLPTRKSFFDCLSSCFRSLVSCFSKCDCNCCCCKKTSAFVSVPIVAPVVVPSAPSESI